jgi:hypothetical protein
MMLGEGNVYTVCRLSCGKWYEGEEMCDDENSSEDDDATTE